MGRIPGGVLIRADPHAPSYAGVHPIIALMSILSAFTPWLLARPLWFLFLILYFSLREELGRVLVWLRFQSYDAKQNYYYSSQLLISLQ